MDKDIDIYADLPSINLNTEENEQVCNCEELRKKLDLVASELESLQKNNNNLENNFSSLLKTAKAEIARKDKMIDDLRKRLDDVAFRRNRTYESRDFSARRTPNYQYEVPIKHENVSAAQEIEESSSYQTEYCHDESKNKKIDIDKVSTVFGERMLKRIAETIKEEDKQKMLALNGEIAEESIKENGSRSSVNKNDNESTSVTRDSETRYAKRSEKRAIEEDYTHGNKRIKTEDSDNNVDSVNGKFNHNCVPEYDLKDNIVQYEMKDNFARFGERLDVPRTIKKEQAPFDVHRGSSEDAKQTRSSNEWKREERSERREDSRRFDGYDGSRSRKGSVDSARNYRHASTSSHILERYSNNEYKNGYRYSPSRRHYYKSDQESSSSHRLRERSSRIYRDRKYDDYRERYGKDRAKKDYDSKEYDNEKSRYGNREHVDLRDRLKHSSSDVEDNGSYRYKHRGMREEDSTHKSFYRQKNRGTKESTPDVSDSKKSHKRSRPIGTRDATNLNNLEEGEILDSPKKKHNAPSIRRHTKLANNNANILENKVKVESASASVDDQADREDNVISAKQKVEDIKIDEVSLRLPQARLEDDRKETPAQSSDTNNAATDKECNSSNNVDNTRSSRSSNNSANARVNDINEDSCNDHTDKKVKSCVIESPTKLKDRSNSIMKETNKIIISNESDIESIENCITKEETNEPDTESATTKSTRLHHLNDDGNRETENEEPGGSPAAKTDKDEPEVQDGNEIANGVLEKSDAEMSRLCLSDHNYVRDPAVESAKDSDVVQRPPVKSDCKIDPEATTAAKETKGAVDGHSISHPTNTTTSSSVARNKKNGQAKGMIISRRRRAVTLSDSNASMTILMNKTAGETSVVNNVNCNGDDCMPKPRLRAANSRGSSKICK